jgi:two-component system sensor histidine kinase VicK
MFFKSLQWRLVSFFCLVAFCVVVPISLFLNNRAEEYYYENFVGRITRGLQAWNYPVADPTAEQLKAEMRNNAFLFTANEEFRSYTVATKNAIIIDTNDRLLMGLKNSGDSLEAENQLLASDNFVQAMTGIPDNKKIMEKASGQDFFDYAYPLGDYVLYFRYYQDDWAGMIEDFNRIILTSLVLSLAVSLAVGYLLSKTITVPIAKLNKKAKSIASGDFDQLLEVKSNDEISQLTETFNNMAVSLKKTLTEVTSEKNKMETIFNYMTDGVIAFNLKGEVIHTNPASRRILGFEEDTFQNYAAKLNLEYSLNDVIYLSSTSTKEVILDIGETVVNMYFAVFTGEDKKPEGVIAVIHDITEQERLENMRKDFVANVSHELRTPLTSIRSYSETLLDGALEDKEMAERFLGVIVSESDRMTRLVKDLLDLSRLDNRQIKLSFRKISFVDLVKSAVESMRFEAETREQQLECFVLGEIPMIEADHDRVEQVIYNLLSNAIKYTSSAGLVTLRLGLVGSAFSSLR